jgi:pimeloyl-ACP methyl ester carboxylesterase
MRIVAGLIICLLSSGCASSVRDGEDLTLLVVGAAGDGPWYDGLRGGLAERGAPRPVQTMRWGAPLPLAVLNLQGKSIHDAAERKLAKALSEWRSKHPDGRLTLVGHSAGCGVILGGLAMSRGANARVVILLAPSVSPGYDLAPALANVGGAMHVFHSTEDDLFLRWRTSTFGTYDDVRTAAAGNVGFTTTHPKLVQHPYDGAWRAIGNDGSHDGALARAFVTKVISPLCAAGSTRSSVANSK